MKNAIAKKYAIKLVNKSLVLKNNLIWLFNSFQWKFKDSETKRKEKNIKEKTQKAVNIDPVDPKYIKQEFWKSITKKAEEKKKIVN